MVNTGDLVRQFATLYPCVKPAFLVRAPGRVNLIGEHTDYNDGFVLPIAMLQALHVVAGPANDEQIVIHSTAFNESVSFPAKAPGQPGVPSWTNYVRGVAAMLLEAGVPLSPGRLLIDSQVPLGGGVSSSAALEVGTAMAMLSLAGRSMEPVPLALLARQAEHRYAGSPCGIMDQFICVLGRAGHALLLDCRSQAFQQIPLPMKDAELMVMNTQVKHQIGSSEYPVRQRQCKEGLAPLQQSDSRIKSLRDVSAGVLNSHQSRIEPVAFQRCRHVVTEIERTIKAGEALKAGDLQTFGKLMFESHASLRDDYAVSCAELDALVEICRGVPGVYGARMTGGGFGGCAIALIRKDAEKPLQAAITERYNGRFERPAIVYTTQADDGAAVQTL